MLIGIVFDWWSYVNYHNLIVYIDHKTKNGISEQ